jgi:hypothetical protein
MPPRTWATWLRLICSASGPLKILRPAMRHKKETPYF